MLRSPKAIKKNASSGLMYKKFNKVVLKASVPYTSLGRISNSNTISNSSNIIKLSILSIPNTKLYWTLMSWRTTSPLHSGAGNL